MAKKTFGTLDHWMFGKSVRYAKHTHAGKPWHWLKNRYWGKLKEGSNDIWVFGDKTTGARLLKFSWFKIERHPLVKGKSSPDDPRLRHYWEDRQHARINGLLPYQQKMARNQGYKCPLCKQGLFNGEELHEHHIEPRSKGGKDVYSNLRLVHLFCHQQIHSGKATSPNAKELLKL